MKSIIEVKELLISELYENLNKIKSFKENLSYYNELLGATSYILANLLELNLKNKSDDWNYMNWIDDSLLTKVKLKDFHLSIWGIMIWGKENEPNQWTEPFYFEIELDKSSLNFSRYTFLFGDLKNCEITYEDFNKNRSYWDQSYYLDNNWDISERNWRYIINSE